MNSIVELFPAERQARLARRSELVRRLLQALALAALAACIVLTAGADNFNLYRRMAWCIGVSVLTAWLWIYFGSYYVRDARRELEHAAHLAEGEREILTGKVTVLKQKVRIRGSITVRKVRVESGAGSRLVSVHIDKADQLRRAGERLKLYVVHGYVAAYEVMP